MRIASATPCFEWTATGRSSISSPRLMILSQLMMTSRLLKAWSLFHIGSLVQAKIINDRLRQARRDPNDARLEVSLAVVMGTWENFPDIVNREWAERDKREPRYLLHLAQLAADFDKDRAIELGREARRKASDSPEVLTAASLLAYRLGQDSETMPWMVEAARLSPAENGPVKTAGMRDVIAIAMAGVDATRGVQEAFSEARIPLHTAAPFLKMPMTRLLVSQPLYNERERDPRRRTVIPVRHGVRGILDMTPVRTIVADITSLLLLAELDLLPVLEKRFYRIAIPWSTMELLLIESQSCRFHQPSRIAGAKSFESSSSITLFARSSHRRNHPHSSFRRSGPIWPSYFTPQSSLTVE